MRHPGKLKFLIVDDFSTMRRIVRGLLKEMGYTDADEAEDGALALGMLQRQRFDFVVSDINLPNMNGFALQKAIKADPALRHIPVLRARSGITCTFVSSASGALRCCESLVWPSHTARSAPSIASRIRRPNAQPIPERALMVTAKARKQDIVLALHSGAAGYIVKPFTMATLETKLNQIMQKRVTAR